MHKETRSVIPNWMNGAVRSIMRRISVHGNVQFGTNFRIGRGAIVGAPHQLTIGHDVAIGPRSVVQVDGTIGDFVLIGMHVQIVGREDHDIAELGVPMTFSTWVGNRVPRVRDSVDIGRDVWIGASSVILGGVTIGEGSVVGAGAVVTHDVPSYSIVVGNPARVVARRFEAEEERTAHGDLLSALSAERQGAAAGHSSGTDEVKFSSDA